MRLAESLGRDLAWEKAVGIKSSFKFVLYDWYPTVSNQYSKSQINFRLSYKSPSLWRTFYTHTICLEHQHGGHRFNVSGRCDGR